ncbi:hypothetical protein B0H14DRAFT_2627763 [Mycena olivaceomarginata]|nr:hypothetical protein B0H14DRAFT_2627763 [Mycena olivaceomarginata]
MYTCCARYASGSYRFPLSLGHCSFAPDRHGGSVQSYTALVLLISNHFPRLPPNFRFLITSRRHEDIAASFDKGPQIIQYLLDVSSQEDIQWYITHRLTKIRASKSLSDGWPGTDRLGSLVKLADGFFFWAATACNLIQEAYEPSDVLAQVLTHSSNLENQLTALYTTALEETGWLKDPDFRRDASTALTAISCAALAKVPLTETALDSLLDLESGKSATVLGHLESVIEQRQGQPPKLLHSSFVHYILEQGPSVASTVRLRSRFVDISHSN